MISTELPRDWRKWLPDTLSILLLCFAVLRVFATYEHYAISWDEPVHLKYGDHIVNWYKSLFENDTALHFRRDYLYGGAFDALGSIARHFSNIDPYDTQHLLGGVIGFFGFVGVWRLGRFLGGPWGGFWSLAFIGLTPVYWGHMFFNPKDTPFAAGYIWGLYYVVRVAAQMPAIPKSLWVKLGLGLAAALCVRIAGLLVVCYLLLAIVSYGVFRGVVTGRWLEAARAWWSMGWRASGSVLIGWVGMLIFWPWAQLRPVWGPFHSLRNMTHFNLHNRRFPFGGEWIRTYEAPWDYLPRFFLYKMPEIVIVTMLLGAVLGTAWALRHIKDPREMPRIRAHTVLALAIVFPPFYAVVRGSALYDGLRHFLFLAPPMCVAAGISMRWLVQAARERHRWASAALVTAAVLLCVRQAAVIQYMHPIEYVWFNAFAGGLPGAEDRYDIDYYGGSYKEAVDLLERHLRETDPAFASSQYTVRACGPSGIIRRYLPDNFHYAKSGRFYLGFTRANCHKKYRDRALVTKVERYGVPINVVRDLHEPLEHAEVSQSE